MMESSQSPQQQLGRQHRRRPKNQLKQFIVQTRVDLEQGGVGGTSTSLSEDDPVAQALADGVMHMLLDAIERYNQQQQQDEAKKPLIPSGDSGVLVQRQLGLGRALQLANKEARLLERKLSDAMLAGKMLVVLHCFTLVHHQYRLYEHAEPYEQLSNEHPLEALTPDQLSLDMLRHEWHYSDLLQRCRYLEQRQPPLRYVLYRRAITLLDRGQPLHSKTPWYHAVFQPHRHGHYYALTVNFGLSVAAEGARATDDAESI